MRFTTSLAIAASTAACVAAPATAADEMTFVGHGTLDGPHNVIPVDWLPGLPHGPALAKGEIVVDQDHRLLHATLETDGLSLRIHAGAAGEVYALVMTHDRETRAFGLVRPVVTFEADVRLQGTIIGGTVEQPFDFAAFETELLMGGGSQPAGGIVDIAVSRLGLVDQGSEDDFFYYGQVDGISAFSMASTSCNVGTELAEWIAGSQARHPVIGQNVFRMSSDGSRFEHIGQSFLKHSFCAVSEPSCGECQPTGCNTLGLGCADTYWATLNDGLGGGRKSDINPIQFGQSHTHPVNGALGDPVPIRGRLQIHHSDMGVSDRFVAEVHYVTHDELPAQRHNNASWREIDVNATAMVGFFEGQESVHFMDPGIQAWEEWAGATLLYLDVPDEGSRVHLAYNVTANGDDTWHYEYVIHNMNSYRSIGGFSVPVPAGTAITNVGFHDVDYHSGEIYDGTDWSMQVGGGAVTWQTEAFGDNVNANAIRWGTAYSFRFDADAPPTGGPDGTATLAMFMPGTPTSIEAAVQIPGDPCQGDVNGDSAVDVTDLLLVLTNWGGPGGDVNGDGTTDVADFLALLANWGPC